MSLSIGMGGDVGYYEHGADNDHVRASDEAHDLHAERARSSDYYTGDVESGRELEGRWIGPGAEGLGLRGAVTSRQLHKLYGDHTDPISGAELGGRPRKYKTPEERLAARLAKEPFATEERKAEIALSVSPKTPHSRNFFDLTFSVPKSYSVLYAALIAAGREDDAQKLIDAHHAAIDECMKVLMDEAGFSRTGHHGRKVAGVSTGERIEAHDFVYSIFDHRLSRCGDPQVHSHVLLLNKVRCEDGKWRALDSDAIVRQQQRSIGALHERFLAERTAATMGLSHLPRLDGFGWEVEGITQADMDLYSTRRRAIDAEAEAMTARFVAKFNREPNGRERDRIAQAATLATRPGKPHDLTFEQYAEQWMQRFEAERGEHLAEVLDRVPMRGEREVIAHGVADRSAILAMAVARCEARHATWGRPQLRQAISDLLPPHMGRGTAAELLPYLDSLVDEAIGSERVVTLSQAPAVEVPESLRHRNGHSIYEPFHTERFTTDSRLRDERRLGDLARLTDGPRLTDRDAQKLIEATTLYPDQARVVAEVLTGGRRLNFLEAKAGTGKSFTIGQVAQLWGQGVGGKVMGLAKSQNATGVLVDEGLDNAFNFDRFRTAHQALAESDPNGPAAATLSERYGIGPQGLLIVDEVSTLTDEERFWLEGFARNQGVTMLWVGDRGQVGSTGANSGLDVLAAAVPPLELDVARRFTNAWEGPASLALHDREVSALIDYDARGRIVAGTREEMDAQVTDALVADIVTGHNSLLMVPTAEMAREYSTEVRRRLVELGRIDPSTSVRLHDETTAAPGDLVQARHTTRQIPGAPAGEGISNRDLFQVVAVDPHGALTVAPLLGHDEAGPALGEQRVLPQSYVRNHVELGYVTTVHSKIGRTVERGYQLVTDASSWEVIYTGATRGKDTNVIFVPVEYDDEGRPVETGVEVLARIAERTETELSAIEAEAAERDAVTHLGRLGPIYDNEIAKHTAHALREVFVEALGSERAAALDHDEATPALYRLVRALGVEGHDVVAVVSAAADRRELGTADSVAQVLHWRITREVGPVAVHEPAAAPERFIDAVPTGDGSHLEYLRRVAAAMDARVSELGEAQAREPEPWALAHLGSVPSDAVEALDWTERASRVAAYREQYGITDPDNAIGDAPGRVAAEQRAAWERAYSALGRPAANDDVARMNDGELLLAVDQYRRVEEWMPPQVSERLRSATTGARMYETTAALARAAGDDEGAERAERLGARLAASAAQLEEVATARRLAEQHYATEREAANAAQAELDRRAGIEPSDPDSATVEPSPSEAVTVAEHDHHVSWRIDDALDRARQVTADIERARQEHEDAERRRLEIEQEQQCGMSNDLDRGY